MSDQSQQPQAEPNMSAALATQRKVTDKVTEIKARPTERAASYARQAENLIEQDRDQLMTMEAAFSVDADLTADKYQQQINRIQGEIDILNSELASRKQEIASLQEAGKAEMEAMAAEYQKQRAAAELILKARIALRDTLKPAIEG